MIGLSARAGTAATDRKVWERSKPVPGRSDSSADSKVVQPDAAAIFLERRRRRTRAGKIWKQCSVLAQLPAACPEVRQLF